MNKIPELTEEQKDIIYTGYSIDEKIVTHGFSGWDAVTEDGLYISPSFETRNELMAFLYAEEKECAKKQYISVLKIADEQGLLTKEASLALKPDNYIEWVTDNVFHAVAKNNKNIRIYIDKQERATEYLITIIDDNNGLIQTFKNIPSAETLKDYQDFCQNWLDEYLKKDK